MKYLLMIFGLLISFGCTAQNAKALEYYSYCNKAELAISDSNIERAFDYYKQAFKINPEKPFSGDLLNAFHCAIDLGYFPEAESYLKRMLFRGVKEEYLESQIYQY